MVLYRSCSPLSACDQRVDSADSKFAMDMSSVHTDMNADHCMACRCRQSGTVTDGSKSIDRRFVVEARRSGRINMRHRLLTFFLIVLTLGQLPLSDACFPGGRLIRRLPKSETPLVFKQHVPNVPENSLAASGPREGRIRRFNKRFQELVVNYNPDILFKDEEGTGEDRIMSVRCKEKLDTLAMLVMNVWPGVKLRVTEAWDQEGIHHASDSLHYEGRAIDITTSDRDARKLGLLARLAAQAGFDWVYYGDRSHVHVSCKSDSVTRHKRVLKCFPGHATVLTESGGRKSMSDVLVGDRVAVLPSAGHRPIFEPVIAFLHRNASTAAHFVEARTNTGRVFVASSEHLIYVSTSNGTNFRSFSAKPMWRMEVGDTILVSGDEAQGPLLSEEVTSIRLVVGHGLYAPLTASGTILVDDVLASCYAAVTSERAAHLAMAPLRLWHRLPSLWPSSSDQSRASKPEIDGVHWYAELLLGAADLLERWGFGKIIDAV